MRRRKPQQQPTNTRASETARGTGTETAVRRKTRTGQALSQPAPFIQARLKIGSTDSPLEREADAVADRVMSTPDAAVASGAAPSATPGGGASGLQRKAMGPDEELTRMPLIQRAGMPEDELPRKPMIQREATAGNVPAVTPDVASGVYGLRGKGQPLSRSDQAFFAPRMPEVDVSQVRVHTDSSAQHLARSVEARAFTFENNVVLGKGEYSPGTDSGRRLMAHELAHVAQQGGTAGKQVARKPAGGLIQRNPAAVARVFTAIGLTADAAEITNSAGDLINGSRYLAADNDIKVEEWILPQMAYDFEVEDFEKGRDGVSILDTGWEDFRLFSPGGLGSMYLKMKIRKRFAFTNNGPIKIDTELRLDQDESIMPFNWNISVKSKPFIAQPEKVEVGGDIIEFPMVDVRYDIEWSNQFDRLSFSKQNAEVLVRYYPTAEIWGGRHNDSSWENPHRRESTHGAKGVQILSTKIV